MRTPQLADNLRRAVLQAAIEGRLNDRTSEDARDLLAAIQTEKAALQKTGKLKKDKPLAAISEEEIPFAIPENWVWVRFGEIFEITSSKRVHQRDWKTSGIPFYRAREIAKLADYGEVQNELFISDELYSELTAASLPPKANDFMVSGIGTLGKTYIVREDDVFYYKDASVLHVRNQHKITPQFFKYYMESDALMNQVWANSSGTTVATLTIERFNNYLIPLPPLTEQQQIVEKLNCLLNEIDSLKSQEQALITAQNAFPKKLRAALLQAAVQGELNERTDENARDLLAAIQAEKTALQKVGKLKKDKPLAAISEEEIPFAIPENWVWVRQQELCWLDNGQKHSGESLPYLEARVIRGSKEPEYKNSGILVEKKVQVILVDGENSGEIMLTPFRGYLGSTFKVLGKTSLIDEKFLMYLFLLNQRTYRENKRGAAIPHLDKDLFKNKLVPLPPLSEQQQIVAKLEALLAEIDTLENAA
ncbi:MAG: restriction endonuclease subunit S [Cardiobacterium sp.]